MSSERIKIWFWISAVVLVVAGTTKVLLGEQPIGLFAITNGLILGTGATIIDAINEKP